jgi:hydrogenase-4 component F
MNHSSLLIWIFLLFPAAAAVGCLILRKASWIFRFIMVGAAVDAGLGFILIQSLFQKGALRAAGSWLRVDTLSAYYILIMILVFLMASIYAARYFNEEIQKGSLSDKTAARFGSLWFGTLSVMTLVLLSNNLGLMWVGIEATTLATTFLISLHPSPLSLEAAWKYVLICSVGIALAFLGTLFVGAADSSSLIWTKLASHASILNPQLMKMAFIFLLIGYGTKVGLAPLHTWLPDAHSQAPAPVSAVFSGFMVNEAMYCIMRYLPIVNGAVGNSHFSRDLLLFFGIFSMAVAAVFILFQHDIKRLLAYSTVEHLGITAIGLGLGGLGVFAALFHTLNHSICKTTGFLSAGKLGQKYGTHDLRKMPGTLQKEQVWGLGLFLSLIILVGSAPFAVFMSELLIIKAAVDHHHFLLLTFFLTALGIVFIGVLSHAVSAVWGEPPGDHVLPEPNHLGDMLLVGAPLLLLLILGIWMPHPLRELLEKSTFILTGKQ